MDQTSVDPQKPIMGLTRITHRFKARVTPDRMFNALILDSHNICPKLMFSSVKSIEFIEGQGEVGSIKQINFTEASPIRYLKHRIDALDKEALSCKYSIIEADFLLDKLDYVSYEVKFEGYGGGGCICKLSSEYKAKEGVQITEVDIELGKDRTIGMYEVLEAYLIAHPRSYT